MSKFLVLDGNHGSTYIFNINDHINICNSLKFYKTLGIREKVIKTFLYLYMRLKYFFPSKKVYSKEMVEQRLNEMYKNFYNFNLDDNCSILISPTRDKIIIHYHDRYYQKFAFGESVVKLKNEAKIYNLMNKQFENFYVLKIYDYWEENNKFCSFKLRINNSYNLYKKKFDIVKSLVEMFDITKKERFVIDYLDELENRCELAKINNDTISTFLEKSRKKLTYVELPFGLVHKDFKIWNINTDKGLLIYDFEEAVVDGPPLEDLLNYILEPFVYYNDYQRIIKQIYAKPHLRMYEEYLSLLNIKIDFKILLYFYLIERTLFWIHLEQKNKSDYFKGLFNYIFKIIDL